MLYINQSLKFTLFQKRVFVLELILKTTASLS